MKRKKFTDYIVEKGLLNQEDLDKALAAHKKKGGSLVELLVQLGYLKEAQLVDLLSGYLSIPPVRILNLNIPKEVIALIPETLARDQKVLPIGKIGNTLTVAMGDPLNVLVIDDIKKITKCEVNPIISPLSEIREAISTYYSQVQISSIEDIIKGEAPGDLEIIKRPGKEESQQEFIGSIEEAPVIKFTNSLLAKAVEEGASDVLIEPLEQISRVRFRIDGILRQIDNFSKKIHPYVISRIKVMCNLNISEHRLPQEGRFRSKMLNKNVDFRVSVLPTSVGEKVAIRVLDKTTALLDLGRLGFEDEVLKQLKVDSLKSHGLFLVCGPTGTGKTTTLYSVIEHIYSPEKNIVTVEDPIEYQLKGINQVSINPAVHLTFAACLRSILRQDPDIIMIGEIRDADTADMGIKSALTGHLVLSTLHTTTSAGSITRLVNMGVEAFLLSSTLVGVLTQRLVRVLCPKCKEKMELSDSLRQRYLIAKQAQLYKAKGCQHCQNTGYKGRVAVCEYLSATLPIKNLVNSKVSESMIKKQARKLGMRTLRQDGILKIEKGITTLEEVLKVTAPDEPLT
ncbi:MAG: Flp pilus assembly complex ATPase component TadA [Candidatus Omnitrophica bacterium]|nr:Flp pilus assembly complex ATPase component TadA [Candidatus Omnitrophota bacterium]MBU2043819.1 Flp pilus assembly complex ATPase component TadA [Candidatus Omnitrophota bacterium]MBU2251743.1 Flp pilus assembly complex ATPase component TadA [Candidatus Omnitrophota bacterium]MBU2265596.1 Flp pilus assembly complex ATPase component TadA [Candidatus Omnitrophota bacterium]MBU2473157.1 Flp pilus assembly complex ATPase component TadA [Candidatus Omnitrophota bacterium]